MFDCVSLLFSLKQKLLQTKRKLQISFNAGYPMPWSDRFRKKIRKMSLKKKQQQIK